MDILGYEAQLQFPKQRSIQTTNELIKKVNEEQNSY